MTKLQVNPFTARFSGDHDLSPSTKQIHHPILFAPIHTTAVGYSRHIAISKILQQVFLCCPVFGKEDHLVIHFSDKLHGFLGFAIRLNCLDNANEFPDLITERRIGSELLR
ncbi:hypothetical protein D3C77_571810 [compost metagenome]